MAASIARTCGAELEVAFLAGSPASRIAVGGDAVWVSILSAAASGGSTPPRTWRKLSCARSPSKWVAGRLRQGGLGDERDRRRGLRIDPRTNRARVVSGMTAPRVVAVGEGVWVTVADLPSVDAALPDSVCSGISGLRPARLMLVSDLHEVPLAPPPHRWWKGSDRPRAARLQGGSHRIEYQSCDSSTAQAGRSDEYRCTLNAKAYARNPDVMAVIGA